MSSLFLVSALCVVGAVAAPAAAALWSSNDKPASGRGASRRRRA